MNAYHTTRLAKRVASYVGARGGGAGSAPPDTAGGGGGGGGGGYGPGNGAPTPPASAPQVSQGGFPMERADAIRPLSMVDSHNINGRFAHGHVGAASGSVNGNPAH